MSETCQKLAFTHPIAVLKSGLKNNWMKKLDRVNRPLNNFWGLQKVFNHFFRSKMVRFRNSTLESCLSVLTYLNKYQTMYPCLGTSIAKQLPELLNYINLLP